MTEPLRHIKAVPLSEWKSDQEIIAEQKAEIKRLRSLIRNEQMPEYFEVDEDATTELAVKLAYIKIERDRLKNANLELQRALGFGNKTGHHPIPREKNNGALD